MDGTMSYEIMRVDAEEGDDWDYYIYAGDLGDGSQAKRDASMVKIAFRSRDSEAGFAYYTDEPNGSGIGGDTYQVMFKLGSKGYLRFETRRQFVECSSSTSCQSGDRKYTRHTRMYIDGTVTKSGAFDSITNLQGIDSTFDYGTRKRDKP